METEAAETLVGQLTSSWGSTCRGGVSRAWGCLSDSAPQQHPEKQRLLSLSPSWSSWTRVTLAGWAAAPGDWGEVSG